jgi:micrococcal nuclease
VRRHVLALLLGIVTTACAPTTSAPLSGPVTASTIPVPDDAQEAVVVRVVDGDTAILRGRGVGPLPGEPTRVRILLIDTPEVHREQECFGAEASERMRDLLPERAPVRVQADRDLQDRFDRTLLHVWNAGGANVGEVLVAQGYATVLHVEPNDRYLTQFRAREEQARQEGAGLWSACR